MIINSTNTVDFQGMTRRQMYVWKYLNGIPQYTNATYKGFTGLKNHNFPLSQHFQQSSYPDITQRVQEFETEILQELKESRGKVFGYIRALWKMCQNFGTGAVWDSKFYPQFPGRNTKGKKQYAMYNGKVVSANDISNMLYGHACSYMGFPAKLAQLIGILNSKGLLEPFSKGKLPNKELLTSKISTSNQQVIAKSVKEFNINDYDLQ